MKFVQQNNWMLKYVGKISKFIFGAGDTSRQHQNFSQQNSSKFPFDIMEMLGIIDVHVHENTSLHTTVQNISMLKAYI